jgi:adenylosuccinate lyase
MLGLVKGKMGRQLAHETVRRLTMKHYETGEDLIQLVKSDPEVQLRVGAAEVDKLMDPKRYAANAGKVVDRVLARLEKAPPEL